MAEKRAALPTLLEEVRDVVAVPAVAVADALAVKDALAPLVTDEHVGPTLKAEKLKELEVSAPNGLVEERASGCRVERVDVEDGAPRRAKDPEELSVRGARGRSGLDVGRGGVLGECGEVVALVPSAGLCVITSKGGRSGGKDVGIAVCARERKRKVATATARYARMMMSRTS